MQSGSEDLFERGTKSMRGGNYRNAIGYFENLEARYPFSNQAKQAQINLIYCYYRNGEPEAATDASIQFERENQTHARVDYALYMRGLANFRGEKSTTQRLLRMNLAKRPPVQARESFSAFSRLIQRYPNSIYAADSRQRMIFLRNRLAEHETMLRIIISNAALLSQRQTGRNILSKPMMGHPRCRKHWSSWCSRMKNSA